MCLHLLQIPEDEEVSVVIEDDGTLVDSEEFFKKLPSQTVFIFLFPGEQWKGGKRTVVGWLLSQQPVKRPSSKLSPRKNGSSNTQT